MRKREVGQALILVLILLGIGALMVVPTLKLTTTALNNTQVVLPKVKGLYAADAAQDYVLWKLRQPDFVSQFTYDGQSESFTFDACGMPVFVTIVMRAIEGEGGIPLATDDVIRPTKTVDCGGLGGNIPNDWSGTVTYTIELEQLSDNTSQGLDAIYDILPKAFSDSEYVTGSSYFRVEGGSWEPIADPLKEVFAGQTRLRWPASGDFPSPIRDFMPRQVKELKFQMNHSFSGEDKDKVHPNWVVLKPWNTISGPQAAISVGNPPNPDVYYDDGLLYTTKLSDPEVIQPGVETDIKYTIIVTNQDGETHQIQEITDYMPPGFEYIGPTSNMTTDDPISENVTINGIERVKLLWTTDEFPQNNAISIASGETLTLVFWAQATKEQSGLYFNEAIVVPNAPIPTIFSDLGISLEEFNSTYTWNCGAVMVPAYDTQTQSDGTIINGNMSFTISGITMTSWHQP